MTPPVLARVRDLIDPAMRAAVDSLVEHLRLPAAYHLGWCDADGNPTDAGAGKGMRGALTVSIGFHLLIAVLMWVGLPRLDRSPPAV